MYWLSDVLISVIFFEMTVARHEWIVQRNGEYVDHHITNDGNPVISAVIANVLILMCIEW